MLNLKKNKLIRKQVNNKKYVHTRIGLGTV